MKNNKYIEIKDIDVCGVNNSQLVFFGKKLKKYDEILIYYNKKSLKYDLKQYGKIDEFLINCDVPKESGIIEIYVKKGSSKYFIYSLKNTKIKRLKNKFTSILRRVNVFIYIKHFFIVIGRGIRFAWRQYHFLIPPRMWYKYLKLFIFKIRYRGNYLYNPFIKSEYQSWIKENTKESSYEKLKYNPLISIVIPVYNVSKKLLSECLDSILNQEYKNFEVCLADDHSTNKETIDTLRSYQKKDKRIKVVFRKENGHISRASNSALEIVKGEFVAMMDNDDVIPKNALYEMVKKLNENKSIDFIYTDEDKLDLDGTRCDPNFKPDYSPDSLLSSNYFCHFTLLRTSILKEIGGWKVGYEGAQDYDLFLRFTEKTTPDKICHIPKILYHWRKVEGSTSMAIDNKNYAIERGKKAVEDALKRRNIKACVHVHDKVPYYWIEYALPNKKPLVSIIIPTKDYADITEDCLKSIYEKTTYDNFEIILANNASEKPETFRLFEKYKKKHKNFKVIDINTEFNFSYINNEAVKKAKGSYIILLNNDTKIITPNWIELMLGYAMQKHVGTVGAKLLYPDNTVQHAGVVIGLGGVAAHAFINSRRDNPGMYGRLSVPYDYAANTAACIMISKKKYNEVGGLEETLKVAYNDIDFNLKLLEKGYYNVFIPMVELYHYESKSRGLDTTSEKYKRFLKESQYMYEKWGKYIENDPFYNVNLSKKGSFMLDKKIEEKK